MKKLFLTLALFVMTTNCFAKKEYISVWICITGDHLYQTYTTEGYIDKTNDIKIKAKDEKGESIKFKSIVEILNYYSNFGYELVPIDLNRYNEGHYLGTIDHEKTEWFSLLMCKDIEGDKSKSEEN